MEAMLFIGDIHITTKRQHQLLEKVRACIDACPDEKNIIFMGDYVYQFSYDRKALLGLFHLFTELYAQGKSVYVLAGNHDRIADHFAYEEAKQAFDLLFQDVDRSGQPSKGTISFITQPTFVHLEGQDILFFPFTHHFDKEELIEEKSPFFALSESVNRNERLSAKANSRLRSLLQQWRARTDKSPKLLLIHHRYLVKTAFPGQQAKFSYASPGLSEELLEMDDLLLVSGHLHQAFVDRNYLCTGSIWHTSSLEVNQQKRTFRCDPQNSSLQAIPCTVNPYVMIDGDHLETVTKELLGEKIGEMRTHAFSLLQGGVRKVDKLRDETSMDLSILTLLIKSSRWSYHDIEKHVASDLLGTVKDVKLKTVSSTGGELLTDLEQSALALDRSISDRKSLLRTYLQRKYPDRYGLYEQFLQELELL